MARQIVVIGVILFLTIIGWALPAATSPAAAQDSTPAAVKIVCTWQRTSGQLAYDVTVNSLGTVIAPNIILTHNHYGLTLGRRLSDSLVITDKAGHTWHWRAVDAQLIVINAGTNLLWLPDRLSLPTTPIANGADLQRLAVGNWLTVNYWDDNTRHLSQRDFQIVQIKDGVARLADPDRVINSGDSGGGVYFNGKLVGNIWSINLDSTRRAAGSFNVALLPSQVRSYMK